MDAPAAEKKTLKACALKKEDLTLIGAVVCTVKAKDLDQLEQDPAVRYVTPDRQLQPKLDYANETTGVATARSLG